MKDSELYAIFKNIYRMILRLHKRIVKVENRMKAQDADMARKRKTILRLCNRYYAQAGRRAKGEK